jgi:hypothetical protein
MYTSGPNRRSSVSQYLRTLATTPTVGMPSSGMRCPVAFLRTDFSGEHIVPIIRVERINYLGTTLAVTSNFIVIANIVPSKLIPFTLIMEAKHSSEMLVLTRTTQCHTLEDGILLGHRREDIKSCISTSKVCVILVL